jgi:hypothetical protein
MSLPFRLFFVRDGIELLDQLWSRAIVHEVGQKIDRLVGPRFWNATINIPFLHTILSATNYAPSSRAFIRTSFCSIV